MEGFIDDSVDMLSDRQADHEMDIEEFMSTFGREIEEQCQSYVDNLNLEMNIDLEVLNYGQDPDVAGDTEQRPADPGPNYVSQGDGNANDGNTGPVTPIGQVPIDTDETIDEVEETRLVFQTNDSGAQVQVQSTDATPILPPPANPHANPEVQVQQQDVTHSYHMVAEGGGIPPFHAFHHPPQYVPLFRQLMDAIAFLTGLSFSLLVWNGYGCIRTGNGQTALMFLDKRFFWTFTKIFTQEVCLIDNGIRTKVLETINVFVHLNLAPRWIQEKFEKEGSIILQLDEGEGIRGNILKNLQECFTSKYGANYRKNNLALMKILYIDDPQFLVVIIFKLREQSTKNGEKRQDKCVPEMFFYRKTGMETNQQLVNGVNFLLKQNGLPGVGTLKEVTTLYGDRRSRRSTAFDPYVSDVDFERFQRDPNNRVSEKVRRSKKKKKKKKKKKAVKKSVGGGPSRRGVRARGVIEEDEDEDDDEESSGRRRRRRRKKKKKEEDHGRRARSSMKKKEVVEETKKMGGTRRMKKSREVRRKDEMDRSRRSPLPAVTITPTHPQNRSPNRSPVQPPPRTMGGNHHRIIDPAILVDFWKQRQIEFSRMLQALTPHQPPPPPPPTPHQPAAANNNNPPMRLSLPTDDPPLGHQYDPVDFDMLVENLDI